MVDVPVPERLRGELQDGRSVIVGVRPEHMEDASLVTEQRHKGVVFSTTIDLLESMGSELYAHFTVGEGLESVESEELRELAEDAGAGELPRAAGEEGRAVARLSADAQVRVGREIGAVARDRQAPVLRPGDRPLAGGARAGGRNRLGPRDRVSGA